MAALTHLNVLCWPLSTFQYENFFLSFQELLTILIENFGSDVSTTHCHRLLSAEWVHPG